MYLLHFLLRDRAITSHAFNVKAESQTQSALHRVFIAHALTSSLSLSSSSFACFSLYISFSGSTTFKTELTISGGWRYRVSGSWFLVTAKTHRGTENIRFHSAVTIIRKKTAIMACLPMITMPASFKFFAYFLASSSSSPATKVYNLNLSWLDLEVIQSPFSTAPAALQRAVKSLNFMALWPTLIWCIRSSTSSNFGVLSKSSMLGISYFESCGILPPLVKYLQVLSIVGIRHVGCCVLTCESEILGFGSVGKRHELNTKYIVQCRIPKINAWQ